MKSINEFSTIVCETLKEKFGIAKCEYYHQWSSDWFEDGTEKKSIYISVDATGDMHVVDDSEYEVELKMVALLLGGKEENDSYITNNKSFMDTLSELLMYLNNQQFDLPNAFPARGVESSQGYGLLSDYHPDSSSWRTSPSILSMAETVKSKADDAGDDVTVSIITWEQNIRLTDENSDEVTAINPGLLDIYTKDAQDKEVLYKHHLVNARLVQEGISSNADIFYNKLKNDNIYQSINILFYDCLPTVDFSTLNDAVEEGTDATLLSITDIAPIKEARKNNPNINIVPILNLSSSDLTDKITSSKDVSKNILTFLQEKEFDGIDINFNADVLASNDAKLTNLLKFLHDDLTNSNSGYGGCFILTLTIGGVIDENKMQALESIYDYVNFINLLDSEPVGSFPVNKFSCVVTATESARKVYDKNNNSDGFNIFTIKKLNDSSYDLSQIKNLYDMVIPKVQR